MVAAARDPDSGGGLAGLAQRPGPRWAVAPRCPLPSDAAGRVGVARRPGVPRGLAGRRGRVRVGHRLPEEATATPRGSFPEVLEGRGPPLKLALCAVVPLKVRETRAWPGVRPGGGLRRAAAVPAALGRGFRFPFKQKTLFVWKWVISLYSKLTPPKMYLVRLLCPTSHSKN